ncbi:nucleotide-diphospho-sugar transferase [Pilobolus umbonatus]|nr:nucleotide-diphospho-sugar transferase [Pilobolus umbonatus]
MTFHWTLPFRILYSVTVSGVFVVPALVGYIYRLQLLKKSFWVLGLYGVIVISFVFLQLLFATLNRIMVYHYKKHSPKIVPNKKISEKLDDKAIAMEDAPPEDGRPATAMGLAVVGYREEPGLFTNCLESVKQLEYPDPFKIVVVIDGNEEDDHEMASIFQKVFPNCPIVILPELLSVSLLNMRSDVASDDPDKKAVDYNEIIRGSITLPTESTAVCYLQPHRGKRHAMYTAFRVLLASECEAVMTTDSDTKFNPRAMLEMESALYWYDNIGAVAGDVRIWNTNETLLSFMSSLRYWMAFNIERAAQSFNRCVTCVSGPMGIYRSFVLEEILDAWITQHFLGMECTYGDDRHLTNQALLRGYRIVYTHLAYCDTETPVKFLRWFKQQTRWSKSFYRELFWNVRSIHKHSPWMAAELFYQGLYPFVLIFSIFSILISKLPFIIIIWVFSLGIVASIKTLYALIVTFDYRFLVFPIYSLYYVVGLIPAKLWAVISLWDVGWGTSARSASEMKRNIEMWRQFKEALPVILWLLLLIAGITYNVVMYLLDPGPTASEFFSVGTQIIPDPTSIIFFVNPLMHPIQ